MIDKQEPTAEEIAKNFDQTREQLVNAQREEIFRVFIGNLTEKYEKGGAVRSQRSQPTVPGGTGRKLTSRQAQPRRTA